MISAYTCMRYSRDRNVIEALKITKVGAEIKKLNPLQMDCYHFNHFLRKVADWNDWSNILVLKLTESFSETPFMSSIDNIANILLLFKINSATLKLSPFFTRLSLTDSRVLIKRNAVNVYHGNSIQLKIKRMLLFQHIAIFSLK